MFDTGVRTTVKDSVEDFLRIAAKMPRDKVHTRDSWCFYEDCIPEKPLEVGNPSIHCGFSREADEQHAPAAISDPFTKRS